MSRVVHFEISADNPERAVKFYHNVFGWKITRWEGPMDYWIITTGRDKEPGINGGMIKRARNETTVNTISVQSVEEYTKKIEQSGGKILVPKSIVPGGGYFARCQDTEGNIFGIIEPGESQ